MNAPANIPSTAPPWQRYIPAVDALVHCANDRERYVRCWIMYSRDRATLARKSATWEAGPILDHIIALAVTHGCASMPIDELEMVHQACCRLMSIAIGLNAHFPGRDR